MMEIKTFDTILTGMCDDFDSLISPKKLYRSNTNVIYLIFKAIAKGYEVINNVCVTLNGKFDPMRCEDEDLDSSASLVGTQRFSGSASGLKITIVNNGTATETLKKGFYTYKLNDDTSFVFEVLEDVTLASGISTYYIAMSEEVGSYPVTEQTSITVESVQTIPADLNFSCSDNSALLGTLEESDLDFRKRILTKTDRQSAPVELEDELKNLPYIFDCKVKFNNTIVESSLDGFVIPPFTALICYSGSLRSEIAEKVCTKLICPTVQDSTSIGVKYESDTFVDGFHTVYFTPFKKKDFKVEVIYKIDETYANDSDTRSAIRVALFNKFVTEVHSDYVKEDEVYNEIEKLGLHGVEILGVNLKEGDTNTNFIEVPLTRIAQLTEVTFSKRG